MFEQGVEYVERYRRKVEQFVLKKHVDKYIWKTNTLQLQIRSRVTLRERQRNVNGAEVSQNLQ